MQSSNISFKANIRIVSANKFSETAALVPVQNFVSSPWTAKEIVSGQKAYTDKIYDCIAGGITNGKKIVMFHICPTYKENDDFGAIEKTILDKFEGKTQNLRGLIVGNKPEFDSSNDLLAKFKNFMTNNNIDYSLIRGLKYDTPSSIAYDVQNDSWLVTNDKIAGFLKSGVKNLRSILERTFKEVRLSAQDNLSRN